MREVMIRSSSAHRHYPSSTTAVTSSSHTSLSWSRPRSGSSNSNSNNNSNSLVKISRYPYLDKEPLVNGVFLRLLVDSHPEDFHVPLEPRVFAYALKRELLAADQIVRIRIRLYREHLPPLSPPSSSSSSFTAATTAAAAALKQIDVPAADKNAILLHLGTSRLLQCWSLPEDVWCTVLAPQLISNLTNCIFMLLSSRTDTIPPPIDAAEDGTDSNYNSNHPNDNQKALVENFEKSGVGGVDTWDEDDALLSRSSGLRVATSAVIALARSLNHRLLTHASSETTKHHTICENSDSSDDDDEEEEEGSEMSSDDEPQGSVQVDISLDQGLEGDGGSEQGAEGKDNSMSEDIVNRQQRCGSVASYRSSQYDELNHSMSVRWSTHLNHPGLEGQGHRRVVMSSRGPGQLLKSSAAALAQLIVIAGECVEQVTPLAV